MGTSPENFTGPPMMSPILGGPQTTMQAPMGYRGYVSVSSILSSVLTR